MRIRSLSRATGCAILAKAELLNPGGSSKDRVALRAVSEAEADGKLPPGGGGILVEGTAGSTGISLALLARARGHGCAVVLPDDVAMEKEALLRTIGAEVIRVPPAAIASPRHYCRRAAGLASSRGPTAVHLGQFENLANFRAHAETTGEEIWAQTAGRLDAFVMAAGTGGTLAGVASALCAHNPDIQVALIDPPGSVLYNKVTSGVAFASQQAESRLRRARYDTITEGIGIDRITANMAAGLPHVQEAFRGTDREAVEMAYYLLRNDGLFVGSSSAMNCVGAVKMARRLGPGHVIVTVLCDSGARYYSKLYDEEFLRSKGLLPVSSGSDLGFVGADDAQEDLDVR